jgi:hypothetical protein
MSFKRTMVVHAAAIRPKKRPITDRFVQGNTRMDPIALYQSTLTIAERAVTTIPSGSRLSMAQLPQFERKNITPSAL